MTICAKRSPAVVLLVEDDLGDQILTKEAFQGIRVPCELRIVSDGQEALDYLYGKGNYASTQNILRPDLILLDLNMPRVNGQQVAERIHSDPELSKIPIVVLTTSQRQEDIVRAYGHGVVTYISKPLDFRQFMARLQELEQLLKLLVSIKNLQASPRLTQRQLLRLARRRKQLERRAEELFDQYMQQIGAVFERDAEEQDWLVSEGGSDGSGSAPLRHESLMRVAQKILEARPQDEARPSDATAAEFRSAHKGERGPWMDNLDCAADLCHLARGLSETPQEVGVGPEEPALGAGSKAGGGRSGSKE